MMHDLINPNWRKDIAAMHAADEARVRAELRDRLDRCTDADHGAAFGWLCDNHPDLVREALDETGAPS